VPCQELLPDVERWQRSLAEHMTIALVSQGGEADNREAHGESGLRNVLLEERREVYEAYRARGTPSAVAVGLDGRIASVTTVGSLEIEELVRLVLRRSGDDGKPRRAGARVPLRQVGEPGRA
jgi:hypothetical protein